MAKELTFDAMWEDLKSQSDEAREILEISEDVANVINSIVKTRIDKGMSQRDLALACGVRQSAIARMERLQVMPRLDTVIKIARKLDLQINAERLFAEEAVSQPISITVQSSKANSAGSVINYNTRRFSTMLAAAFGGGI